MKIEISRHVYGSSKGYQTLAKSAEVTDAEVKELEAISFGQTTDKSYLQSLEEKPAFICRKMSSSGRWGITRIFWGPQDDYGRVTLLFVTALISRLDWLNTINSDVNVILGMKEIWKWDNEQNIPEEYIEVSQKKLIPKPQTVKNALSLLSVVESSSKKNRATIVVREDVFGQEDVRWLNIILPQKERESFSCAVRALSDGLPFTLICMSEVGISGKTNNRTIFWERDDIDEGAPYARYLFKLWSNNANPPWDLIRSCKRFETEIDESDSEYVGGNGIGISVGNKSNVRKYSKARNKTLGKWLAATAILLLLAITILIATHKIIDNRNINQLLKETQSFLSQYPDDKPLPQEQSKDIINRGRKYLNKAEFLADDTSSKKMYAMIDSLRNWLNKVEPIEQKRRSFRDLADSYNLIKLGVPNIYPPSSDIMKKKDMIKNFENYLKSPGLLDENDISQANNAIKELTGWLTSLSNLVDILKKEFAEFDTTVFPIESPKSYSEKDYTSCKNTETKLKSIFLGSTTLKNAFTSPLESDRKNAENLRGILEAKHTEYKHRISKLMELKDNAESEWGKAKSLISRIEDPNLPEGEKNAYLKEKVTYLQKAHSLWPDNSDILNDLQLAKDDLSNQKTNTRIFNVPICSDDKLNDKVLNWTEAFDSRSNNPNNIKNYIDLRDQINSCYNNDPNNPLISEINSKLDNWEKEHTTWMKIFKFINKCNKYTQEIDTFDPKAEKELDEEFKSIYPLQPKELRKYHVLNKLAKKRYDNLKKDLKTVNDRN